MHFGGWVYEFVNWLVRTVLTAEAVELFINSRKARGLSPETIRWYKGILEFFNRKYPTIPTSPADIEAFVADCTAGDERRHGYFRAVRAFYRFLERRYGFENPVNRLDAPKRKVKAPKALQPDELDQLLAFPHLEKIRTALLFLADTGARVGELANLTKQDLRQTPYGYTARVYGKTGDRLIPISNEVYQALMKNLPLGLNLYRLRREISKAFDAANVNGTAHSLRHTFGTLWEGDEIVLQQIMGHSHLTTTAIYRRLRTAKLSEQHNKYSPLRKVFTRRFEM